MLFVVVVAAVVVIIVVVVVVAKRKRKLPNPSGPKSEISQGIVGFFLKRSSTTKGLRGKSWDGAG